MSFQAGRTQLCSALISLKEWLRSLTRVHPFSLGPWDRTRAA